MEYQYEEWIGDLILELYELRDEKTAGVRWDVLRDHIDALGWPMGSVEEMISEWMDKGLLYEPSMGTIAPIPDLFHLHRIDERKRFIKRAMEKVEASRKQVFTVSLRIMDIPMDLGEQIIGILNARKVRSFTVARGSA